MNCFLYNGLEFMGSRLDANNKGELGLKIEELIHAINRVTTEVQLELMLSLTKPAGSNSLKCRLRSMVKL